MEEIVRYLQKKVLRKKFRAVTLITFGATPQEKLVYLCVIRALERVNADIRRILIENKPAAAGRPTHLHYRSILISAIFRSWRMAKGKTAKVSKRLPGGKYNAFVEFSENTLAIMGISNVIDNLDKFRSIGNKLKRSSWTEVYK